MLNKMLNKKTFGNKMQSLLTFFGKSFDGDILEITLNAYYEYLQNLSEEEFIVGVKTAIATLKFFPSAKELRELCYGGRTDEQRAFEKNSVNLHQKALAGYDDAEERRIARENLNLLAACMREGIPELKMLEYLKSGKSLRDLLKRKRDTKIDLSEEVQVFGDVWAEERRVTADDYQRIASETTKRWKEEV